MVNLNSYRFISGFNLLFPALEIHSSLPIPVADRDPRLVEAERAGLLQHLPELSPVGHPLFRSGLGDAVAFSEGSQPRSQPRSQEDEARMVADAQHYFQTHSESLGSDAPLSRAQLMDVYRQYLIIVRNEERTRQPSQLTTEALHFLLEAASQSAGTLGHNTAAEENRADYRLLTEVSQALLHAITHQRRELENASYFILF